MERFTRITPEEQESKTNGPEIEAPEPEQAAPQPIPMPHPQAQATQKMPETISIPTPQFIQMQQQLQAAKELKPLPTEAQTVELSKSCAKPTPGIMPAGHLIETRVIHQTQQVGTNFVEITQTLILCVRCGASLAQIRASLGM